jgi:hypothetical protein
MKQFGYIPSEIDGSEIVFSLQKDDTLPEAYNCINNIPDVINQGSLSICVPCSLSAYLNWKINIKNGKKDDNNVFLNEIYESRTNKGEGMSFKDALKFLRKTGVSTNNGTQKILMYAMIKDIVSLKKALIMNGPCVGALPVYSWDCDFWVKKRGYRLDGYHAISIVGFNEDGFIIRNSWGKEFCSDGYTLIEYENFKDLLEVWTIIS